MNSKQHNILDALKRAYVFLSTSPIPTPLQNPSAGLTGQITTNRPRRHHEKTPHCAVDDHRGIHDHHHRGTTLLYHGTNHDPCSYLYPSPTHPMKGTTALAAAATAILGVATALYPDAPVIAAINSAIPASRLRCRSYSPPWGASSPHWHIRQHARLPNY